ncbi:hypothetical protein RIF29_31763 [Crotalaria pallida]|uniref:Uncharacterized protein n=1 Tax=Crotalaria pallida TaxID=3830 RepID=A0AAN9EPN1_CROPI
MENQNLSENQSLSEFIQYSLSTDPILEHTNSDNNNIAVDVMGVARANNSVEVKKRTRKRTKKCDANGDNMSAQSLISNGRPRGSRQQRILASVGSASSVIINQPGACGGNMKYELVIGTFKQKIKRKNRRLSSGSSNASSVPNDNDIAATITNGVPNDLFPEDLFMHSASLIEVGLGS